jgi:hypothetical protein
MKLATRQPDLFAIPKADLLDRAGPASAEMQAEEMRRIVRPRLKILIDTIADASELPWSEYDSKTNAILFYQMANWLPPPERDSLRASFRAHYARLGALDLSHPRETDT